MKTKKTIQFPFPIFTTKEGKWFVSECPMLGIATQGRNEKEVKENMTDLIKEYLSDPDTPKHSVRDFTSSSLSYVSVPVMGNLLYGQA
ncbi:type II toxin-antitoxin system HicB family antitoxin [Candidatus Parcubacteria bacterium]|nr:type II toxin-antitoxin system HicB family antitoxin [Candidatus Parcubacteria bacterium]